MDNRLDRLEKKIDDQNDHLSSMELTLRDMAADVRHHVKRSDKLEEMVLPLHNLKNEIKFVIKLIYFISALAAIVECIRAFK